jgi:tRNA dimethylallyltransferase
MVEVAKVPKNPELREELSKLSQEELVARLEEADSERAKTIDKNSPHRVMRAIEIAEGRSADSATRRVGEKKPDGFSSADRGPETVEVLPENIEPLWIGLNAPRKYLYNKIDRRVDKMVEAGLLDEVKSLVDEYGWDAPALDSIGYIEFKKYFEGEKSKKEQIQRVKYNSHAYARRQLTWFRRNEDINWLDITDEDFEHKAEEMVRSYLEN